MTGQAEIIDLTLRREAPHLGRGAPIESLLKPARAAPGASGEFVDAFNELSRQWAARRQRRGELIALFRASGVRTGPACHD
jgi:hypothetical protein